MCVDILLTQCVKKLILLADASVGFAKSAVNITEGEVLEVCLELSMVPAGGVACDITASLAAQPSLYGKQGNDINS
jgi:hypothetical protein